MELNATKYNITKNIYMTKNIYSESDVASGICTGGGPPRGGELFIPLTIAQLASFGPGVQKHLVWVDMA